MHILWGILKIAGIILLIVLGLLLLILMIVLFIPVRYRGRITTGGDFTKTWDPDRLYVLVEATWLLKLVHVSIELREKKIRLIVKAAWKTIMQRGDQEEPEPERSQVKEPEKRQPALEEPDPAETEPEEPGPEQPKPEQPELEQPKPEQSKPETPEAEEPVSPSSWFYETPSQESGNKDDISGGEDGSDRETASGSGGDPAPVRWVKKVIERLKMPRAEKDGGEETDVGLVTRLYQKAADRLFDLLDRADTKVDELDRKADEFCKKLRGIDPLTDWVSRGYYGWVLYKVLKMIAHFGVRKMRGHIRFGTGSPYLTAVAGGALYSWLPIDEITKAGDEQETSVPGDEMRLVPVRELPGELTEQQMILEADFYRLKMDVDTDFKGHMRVCHAAWLVIQAVTKRDTWMMLKKIKNRRR